MITIEEMEKFSQGFFESHFKSILRRSVNARELFSVLDHNNDGQVSYSEFLTGAADKAKLLNEEHLRAAFNLLDRNGDGYIQIEELKWRFSYLSLQGIRSQKNVCDDNQWDLILQDFAGSADGNISFE